MAKANCRDDGALTLFNDVMNCGPLLVPELLDEVAGAVRDNEQIGIPWRITTVLATKDGDFYKMLATNAEAAKTNTELLDYLEEFSNRLEMMRNFAVAARARIMVASCGHDDFPQWCAGGGNV